MTLPRVQPPRRALALGLVVVFGVAMWPAEGRASPPVVVLEVKGVIGVAASGYVARGLDQARVQDASLVVLRMDTPGGLLTSTREIVQAILASPVPVAVYVAPAGARAASAGTYIVYASHVAAMAPGTHLGAATPVALGVPGMPESPDRDRRRDDGERSSGTMERKVVNDAAAYLRGLAQLRGRNAEWAEQAVRAGATLTAAEALGERVVDLVARDLDELLAQLDGRGVSAAGAERVLATKDAAVLTLAPDWRERALGVISDPNVAYLLLLIGIYGIILEFWNPGFVAPGVIGAIALLLALAALAVLPVDYAGLALILLGIALMIAEAFTPGVVVLGIGGLIAFVAGSIFLFDPAGFSGVDFRVGWPVILTSALTSAAFLTLVLGLALKARRRAVVSGVEEMVGGRGRVIDWAGPTGRVRIHGEIWQARGGAELAQGEDVRVVRLEGLTLIVEPETPRR
ncbi:MAG: NfeD family protein [Pseudomonadota bacterium]